MSAEQPEFTWRKSSFSGEQVNCVEVSRDHQLVGIRDTKNPDGGALLLAADTFDAFLRTTRETNF